ncbi:hypothetical protein P9314_10015 [Paenibacillus validus]|uniref:hypothetical protein n=1 Tax=Paenibacillus validus TaxID=44253 RepID=UPI000FD7D2E7|nr:hypothetical protein [Paenibacillus validus]MED4601036.1 hypothetical protein [Paenibacillus validus]MED4604917.1 hypothetical protein [Paenibacillus validus]
MLQRLKADHRRLVDRRGPAGSLRKLFAAAAIAVLTAGLLPMQQADAKAADGTTIIGDDVGDVLATDIKAYVQGKPIRSMNIDGYTAVVAEDLRQYGFDVVWTPADRKVTIYNRPAKTLEAPPIEQEAALPVGMKLSDVLYTDIRTYYGDQEIPSYNLNGRTAIRLNDLDRMGLVEWNEQAKTIAFTPAKSEAPGYPPMENAPLVLREVNSIELKDIVIGNDTVVYQGQTIGKIVDGSPMISLAFMGEALGYDRTSLGSHSGCGQVTLCLYNGIFGMMAHAPNVTAYPEHPLDIQLYGSGGQRGRFPVKAVPADADSDVLVSERDLQQLFGYNSQWNPDTKKLDILYVDYKVDDYGLPADYRNYYYAPNAVGYMTGTVSQFPELRILDRRSIDRTSRASSIGLIGEAGAYDYGGRKGLSKYQFQTELRFDIGSYGYDLDLKVGQRILFSSELEFNLTPETADPVIDYPDPSGFGEISRISFDQPALGYTETEAAEVVFSGTASKRVGSGLTVLVERQVYGGGYELDKKFEVPFEGDRFSFTVDTSDDYRYLTKVTVRSQVSYPRGTYEMDVARFYLKKPRPQP